MNNFIVFASANSRLHADIILIRLRRAKIDCRKISVLFPSRSMPNAVGCWLPVAPTSKLKTGTDIVVCAGSLRKMSSGTNGGHDDGREIRELLTQTGLDVPGANNLAERIGQGHILLGVHAASETDAAIVWHVFRHAGAESIMMATTPSGRSKHRATQNISPWVHAAA